MTVRAAASAMDPFGRALRAYLEGDSSATLIIRRDDGLETSLPAALFFRRVEEFSPLETVAIEACRGHVLDVGARSGLHSLELRRRGLEVTAIDVSADSVRVMRRRGLQDAQQADVFTFKGGPFDTLLLLGNGAGIAGTHDGLRRLLDCAAMLSTSDGQVLIGSLDVSRTDDPAHLAYHMKNRRAGLPIGMTRLRAEFGGVAGPWFGWPHFDQDGLRLEASHAGWGSEVLVQEESGQYLAGLCRAAPVE